MKKHTYYYDEETGEIASGTDGILYDAENLEGMSVECKKRLAELHTEHPEMEFDWLAASRILIAENLLESF